MNTQIQTLNESIKSLKVSPLTSGFHWDLYLDPEKQAVYLFQSSNSIPESPYNGIDLFITRFYGNEVNESLIDCILSVEDNLASLLDLYQGSEFNGRDYVGRWSEDADPYREMIIQKIQDREIAQYWEPSEWYSCSEYEIKMRALEGKTAEDIIQVLGTGDTSNGMVDETEAIEWMKQHIENKLADWQEQAAEENDRLDEMA